MMVLRVESISDTSQKRQRPLRTGSAIIDMFIGMAGVYHRGFHVQMTEMSNGQLSSVSV